MRISAGFLPSFSQEFEWYNFEETPQSIQEKQFRNLQAHHARDVWLFHFKKRLAK